ncbi:hypothetical protein [Paenibacillus polymyxa]|nr:hypothetical protein [Paenibacillus polymyxa]
MASNTPKLGLYMKDPVAEGNDFFDVKTMMNDNWEKIDGFAGVMDGVKERFDTITRQEVTLNAGVQIITAIKSALFSLDGVTGRMLVNLLGRMGNCESVGLWSSNTTIATDTANKTSGTSSFKLTLGSVPATASASFLTMPGKKYVAVADVKNGNTSKIAISINGIAGAVGNEVTSASAFAPSVVRFAATDFFHIVTITGTGSAGNTFNMDSVRVYEISDADYAAAATLTPAQVAAKWPYVDSIMPVRNPYAIRWTDTNKTDIASMLALQTDLYADPVTGENADTVFEREGQYFKSKKWNGLTLDGSLPWVYYETATGYKVVRLPITNGLSDKERVAKYDGKLIQHAFPVSASDQSYLSAASNALGLSIPVADSGWADGYTPTTDDIKAYFYGYKAYDANTFFPADAQVATTATWSGTGTKYWVQRVGAANYTQTVPQASYAGYTPYQLVYQLATPAVEPIISEGQLAFVEGDNQVEVGTGILLREVVKPQLNGQYFINGATTTSSALKNRVGDILRIYRNSKDDKAWEIIAHSVPANQNLYGFKQARLDASLYDPSASYSVTYLMLDKSPVAAFVGSYAANEKTLLADLVDSVQQTSARLSVVENKKAEKDAPSWITPTTLLNGWVSMGVLGYRKINNNTVQVKARIKSGVIGQPFMVLPEGYRPLVGQVRPVHSYTTTDVFAAVLINADGKFIVSGGSNNEVNIYLEFTLD